MVKKLFCMLTLILLVVLSVNARTFVLVTGVSNYGDENVNLSQTTKDAKSFKKVMETQTKDITILTSSYANKANILEKLSAICNRAQKGDRIVFFFSGHGTPGGMCTYDKVLQYSELVDLLASSAATEKVCYIDACHAGTASEAQKGLSQDNESLQKALKGNKDQIFFVSCRGSEYSIESSWVGAGFFTQALIKGLRGKSDANSDKQITVIELFKYIYNDVTIRSKSQQHPQLIAPKSRYDSVLAIWN
jgi:uncharacterized caspase-like protein